MAIFDQYFSHDWWGVCAPQKIKDKKIEKNLITDNVCSKPKICSEKSLRIQVSFFLDLIFFDGHSLHSAATAAAAAIKDKAINGYFRLNSE